MMVAQFRGKNLWHSALVNYLLPARFVLKRQFWQSAWLRIGDFVLFAASVLVAFWLRFDFAIPPEQRTNLFKALTILLICRLTAFAALRIYRRDFRYLGLQDLRMLALALTVGSAGAGLILYILTRFNGFPRAILLIELGFALLMIGGFRIGKRVLHEKKKLDTDKSARVLIVGAGDAGAMVVKEMLRNSDVRSRPVGLVDDDLQKRHRKIHGLDVLGSCDEIPRLARGNGVDEILIAIPTATAAEMRRLVSLCRQAHRRVRTVPSMVGLLGGRPLSAQIRQVMPEDLMHREPVHLNTSQIREAVNGKIVLVTGAGGSIGSEICRQVARFEPQLLILVDRAENSLFYLERKLDAEFPKVSYATHLCDITDEHHARQILRRYRPQWICHAAAYKHVPLMEKHPGEAIINNSIGTLTMAWLAGVHGVKKFVLISTDKAVKPVNFMGTSKKLAEMCLSALAPLFDTQFMSVRFGNVIGSEGSVLKVFADQIARGGPVTVTHRDMERYFMTIPEAVQLILQAAVLGKGGETFILDMGKPVKIYELAKEMIRLSGLEPHKDVEIHFVGLRPGEKLKEELFEADEKLESTEHEKILIVRNSPVLDWRSFSAKIASLKKVALLGDVRAIEEKIKELVPIYRSGDMCGMESMKATSRHEVVGCEVGTTL